MATPVVSTAWERISVDGSEMAAYVASPEESDARPAVVIAQHAPGVDEFIQSMARRFAEAGYVSVAPDLFHREPPETAGDTRGRVQRLRDQQVIVDCQAAIDFARDLGPVARDRVGVVGFCIGGRIAHLVAASTPGLAAAVLFYPAFMTTAWGEGPTPFDLSGGLECPLLALLGSEDHNPTPEEAQRWDDELTRLGKPHDFHFHEGAAHGFMDFTQPERYREDAARQAWQTTTEWLGRHL